MERISQILNASICWQLLDRMCLWFGRQWSNSGVIRWFLNPNGWNSMASESSVFFKLWTSVRNALCWVYEKLRMDRLFKGSMFCNPWVWCAIPAVLAPALSFFRPSLMILGLSMVGAASMLLALVRERERKLAWSPINRYVILYSGVYLVGTVFSVNLSTSLLPGLLSVAFMLFSVVLYYAVDGRRRLDILVFLMVLAAVVVSVYGILQYIFKWGYQSAAWVDSDMFSSISFRVSSTLDNPNMLGEYLILMIPLGGAGLLSAKSWRERLFYLGCCGTMCLCMILTYSRGAWLGLLFAGALFFLLLNPRLILLAPFVLIAMYFVLPETVVSRFTSIGNLGDNSTSYRVYIWLGTLAMLKDYWMCGIGPGDGAYNAVYPAYSFNGIEAPHAHNLFLQIVCDAGIVALAVFVVVMFLFVRMMCAAISREKDSKSRILQIAILSGVFGFMVQAMTDYSFYNYRVMFVFWVYLALGGLAARRSIMGQEDDNT